MNEEVKLKEEISRLRIIAEKQQAEDYRQTQRIVLLESLVRSYQSIAENLSVAIMKVSAK